MDKNNNIYIRNTSVLTYIPLSVHFFLELAMWFWLLMASILVNILYFLLFLITSGIFMGFSARNDPIKKTKFKLKGPLILVLELFAFSLGIYACYELFGIIGFYFQFIFTLGSYFINYQRILWLLGLKTELPNSMIVFSKIKTS